MPPVDNPPANVLKSGKLLKNSDSNGVHSAPSWRPFDYHDLVAFSRDEVEIVEKHPAAKTTKLFRHQNMRKQFLFFLMREGLASLWRKFVSRRFYSRIASKSVFLIVKLKGKDEFYAGFQHSLDQPVYYFLPESKSDTPPTIAAEDAFAAFDPFIGYSEKASSGEAEKRFKPILLDSKNRKKTAEAPFDLYLIGCGDYVRTTVLSAFEEFNPKAAVDFNYEVLQAKWLRGFEHRTNDFDSALTTFSDGHKKCAILASYHSHHAAQACRLLEFPDTTVFIEKPPCVTRDDLRRLLEVFDPKRVFIGYNRRFIPWNHDVKSLIEKYRSPVMINVQITEAQITQDHWYFAPNQGTRVTGNLCHWIDLAVFWIDQKPTRVSVAKNEALGIDYSIFTLHFEDGSMVNFIPSDLGDGTSGVQERISIKNEAFEVRIDDYLRMRIWEKGAVKTLRKLRRDKGHKRMYAAFKNALENGEPSAYSAKDLLYSTLTYIAFVELFYSSENSMELDFSELKLLLNKAPNF